MKTSRPASVFRALTAAMMSNTFVTTSTTLVSKTRLSMNWHKTLNRLIITFNGDDFKKLVGQSTQTGVINVSANLRNDLIDKKLTALLTKSSPTALFGKLHRSYRRDRAITRPALYPLIVRYNRRRIPTLAITYCIFPASYNGRNTTPRLLPFGRGFESMV